MTTPAIPSRRGARCLLACVFVATAIVGGCGGSSDDGDDAAAATDAPTVTDGATDAAVTTAVAATAAPSVDILTDFADVCRGVTLPGATAYDPARAGVHPVMYAIGDHPDYDDVIATMPEQWNPVTGQEQATELVACLARTSETLVETCSGYQNDDGTDSGNTVEMYDATYDVTLRAATTGAEVAATAMTATSSDCPMLFFFDEGDPVGTDHAIPTDELTAWMAEFVET
jgi:hypothetical protein